MVCTRLPPDACTAAQAFPIRRFSGPAGDRDLPKPAQRRPQSEQIEGSRLWKVMAENKYACTPIAVLNVSRISTLTACR